MALRLCHSSLRPFGGVTDTICWSHHWLWHHYCSPAVLTGLIGRSRSLYEQDGQLVDRTNAVTDFLTIVPCRCPLCVIQHLLNRQQQKSSLNILHPFKACLKTHKGPQSHFAVVDHLRTFIWASYVPFFFAWQMPPPNLVPLREWMQLFNEHRSNYHNRETIKEN